MEGATPASDEQFAEWYVWAKREVSSDPRVCLGIAQAAVDAIASGADRGAAEVAGRRSVYGTAVVLLSRVSPWRQGYAQWYDWARVEFGGDPARLHRLARVAIERLKVDGDPGRAAEAARAAAAADPPAARTDSTSPEAGGTSWNQGGLAAGGGWGGPALAGSAAGLAGGAAFASAPGLVGAPSMPGSQRGTLESEPLRPVTFEPVAYAGLGRRLGAAVIDFVLGLVGTALVVVLVGAFWFIAAVSTRQASNEQVALTELALLVILAFVYWLYDAGLESSPAQATIGKRALGLVVVDKYARPVKFGRATGRHFVKFVPFALSFLLLVFSIELLLGGLGGTLAIFVGVLGLVFLALLAVEFFMIAWTRQKQGLHDLIAGTRVVKRQMLTRVVPAPASTPPPPPLSAVADPRPGAPGAPVPRQG